MTRRFAPGGQASGRRPVRLAQGVGAAAVLFVGAACGTTIEKAPIEPDRLRIGVSLPLMGRGGGVGGLADGLMGDPLVAVAWDGRPEPRLAESWSWGPDRQTLHLRIRPNVRFHDGRELTPQIVQQFLQASKDRGDFWAVNVATIKADADAVVLGLKTPDNLLLTDLNFGSVTLPNTQGDSPPVGTGAFRLVSRTPHHKLEAYEHYYRGRPEVGELELLPYQTQRATWAALMRGEIDVLHEVSREAVDFVERESTVKTYSFLRPYYLLLGFNVRHPAFKEPAVRRALNLAVDRDAIVRLAMQGRGEPAHGPIWPHHWAYTSASRAYSFNPEAAKLLLDNAGYRLPVSRKPGQMPSRLRFKCLLLADDPRFEQAALVVQKQLYDIGVDMDIQPMGGLEMVERFASGDFDAFLIEQTSGRSLAWVYRFWHSPSPGAPPLNNSGYTSADSVLDRLRAASTDEDTRAAVNDLQRVLYDDPPAVFLAWGQVSRAVRIEFQVPKNSNPDIIGSLWHWRREPQVITAGQ